MTLIEALEAFVALRFDVTLEGESAMYCRGWGLRVTHSDVSFEMEASAPSLAELEPKAAELLDKIKRWIDEAQASDNPFVRQALGKEVIEEDWSRTIPIRKKDILG